MRFVILWAAASLALVITWFCILPPLHEKPPGSLNLKSGWQVTESGKDVIAHGDDGSEWVFPRSNGWSQFDVLKTLSERPANSNASAYVERMLADVSGYHRQMEEQFKDTPMPQRQWTIADRMRRGIRQIVITNTEAFRQ